jgi:ABC-type phosphate transport system permease subunit
MAKRRLKQVYQRVFFDRLLLVGIIFLALTYIMRGSWGGAFTESATFVIGIIWSTRAATTNPHLLFRLLATLVLLLMAILLAIYLGAANGLLT